MCYTVTNVYDSIRFYDKNSYKNIERGNLKLIQTPQGFKFDTIYNAHIKANKFNFTDDSLLVFNNEKYTINSRRIFKF